MKALSKTVLSLTLSTLLVSTGSRAEDLLQVYQLAQSNDPTLQAAEAGHEAVKALTQQSRALYRPNVNLSASSSRSDQETTSAGTATSSDFSSSGYTLSLSQALYRRDYMTQLNQAEAGERQSQAQLQSTAQALALRAADHYFAILAAQDSLEFALAEKNAIARQLEQTKQRFEVGLIAITDVHEAQAAHDLALASEISARNALAIARQALEEITGQLPGELSALRADIPLAAPTPEDIQQWVDSALKQNFTVIAAEAGLEAAQEGLSHSRAGHHPTVDFVASHSYSDTGGGFFGSRETDDTTLSIQLNLPLYQGGAISAGVSEARFKVTQARQNLEQARRAVNRETRDAYLTVQAGISRVQALKQALISTESALKATEAGYEVGTRTTVDVLNSRRELFRAQRDYARARYDYLLAGLRLKQAAGTLALDDLKQINQWLN